MEEKKSIDRLFQEKLKDFEVFPEPKIWEQIEQRLTKKKRKRILPLWLRLGSAAAVLLVLVSTGFWYFDQEDTLSNPAKTNPESIEKTIAQPNNDRTNEQVISNDQTPNNTIVQEGTVITQKRESSNTVLADQEQKSAGQPTNNPTKLTTQELTDQANTLVQSDQVIEKPKSIDKKTQKSNQLNDASSKINTNINNAVAANQNPKQKDFQITKNDISEAIEDRSKEDNKRDSKPKKWSVGSTIAPVYFNSLSDGSPINASLASNNKETNASLSYGVKVNYQVNDRLSLQSGINNVELAYRTQGVTALIGSSVLQLSDTNIDTNIDGLNLIAISNNQVAAQSSELGTQRGIINLRGDLNQSLNYIEIPMEAKYALINNKVGVHVVGGVSTYVLYGNKISLLDQNGSTILGKASNVNDINFSGNLGLDLDYNLNKKLFINVSPMFKYQMNTFSRNDGGFKPYYLGVYTGLNFRF